MLIMSGSCLLFALSILCVLTTASSTNDSDRLSLLALKEKINDDPLGVLSSWNDSTHYCKWHGITCSRRHSGRVTGIDLETQKLEGTLSPFIGNLSFLQKLNFGENRLHGPIPQEIGRLFRLQILYLYINSFTGDIPTNLTHCVNLKEINLATNNLSGDIPVQLTTLSKLSQLYLGKNSITGTIPPSIGNLSSLGVLYLAYSHLTGSIPVDLCRIRGIVTFSLGTNNLIGAVPSCLYNLSKILEFTVTGNQLHGSLPPDIGLTLPNLKYLFVGLNNFWGSIPISLSNASRLETIALYENQFSGPVPNELGSLQGLQNLILFSNQLGSPYGDDLNFLTSLTNCTNLDRMTVLDNSLKGSFPNSIANLSTTVTGLQFGRNQIHGSFPIGIENLVNLNELGISSNHLRGEIPTFMRMLPKLQKLFLNGNQFSGEIPDSFNNSTLLLTLDLSGNKLRGKIPPTLGNCQALFQLGLANNTLNGTIPKQVIGSFSKMVAMDLSNNAFSGSLPSEVGNLSSIALLDISRNRLSGQIPVTLGKCLTLEQLYLEDNFFEGSIPQSLNTLMGIEEIDLSRNKLVGEVPEYLANFTRLTYLNLSDNEFEGPIPMNGVFANISSISVGGNSKLCGGVARLKLLPCRIQTIKKKRKYLILKIGIPVILISLCILGFLCFLFMRYHKRKSQEELSDPTFSSYQRLRISYSEILKATNSFSDDNLIGIGSYGSVYKGFLVQVNKIVAVKVFNLQKQGGSKSFLSECNALKNLRHRNLLKIITACSSTDLQGNEFKAIVFEFMPNGSLEEWIHPKKDEHNELKNMNFPQRLDIAIEVASALEYLHHHCQPTIVHCDLKPSNILLDENMTVRVADFGLSKIFEETSSNASKSHGSSIAIKGSIGYIAPEYGMNGEASVQGDIYSYGVLLLEMFTGKKPTNDMFQDGKYLHTYAKMALPGEVMNIVDPRMFLKEIDEDIDISKSSDRRARMEACFVTLMRLGVTCSSESPIERGDIRKVLIDLHHIRDRYHNVGT